MTHMLEDLMLEKMLTQKSRNLQQKSSQKEICQISSLVKRWIVRQRLNLWRNLKTSLVIGI
nr:MAG TPA: hypothetical protein [Caudoviricetes sp.]